MWIECRLGVLREDDGPAIVLLVFGDYLNLMRKVQTTYWYDTLSLVMGF